MQQESIRIAMVQSSITRDVRANGAEIRRMMALAAQAGAALVQFPEGALSGYIKAQINAWEEVDWHAQRAELEATMQAAQRLGVWVVLGCNHRLTPPARPHNSLYVISPEGRIATRYDKRRCSNSEISDWYSPGFEPIVFEAGGFRFGCALCIEIQFPDLFMEYERLGADAVLFSSYSRDPIFAVQAQGYAAAATLWISMVVPAICSDSAPSRLIGPNGRELARCSVDARSEFAVATLDRTDPALDVALNRARPWRATARLGDIYRNRRIDDERSRDRTTI